jgi:sugar lactone lactonase YvrE
MDWLARMPASGKWRLETDLGAYEAAANPDGGIPDSDPYGLLAEPGATVATDAGGNDLLRVASNGSITTLATFPSRAQGRSTDSVPTTVARGPDGAYYVGELTGAPFVPGTANIYRVVPGHGATVWQTGFSFVIDIAFAPDGSLYVLQFANGPGLSGPGELWRVSPGGARTLVATGFVAPGSVAIGPDRALYVSNFGVLPGAGTVVRIAP